MKDETIITAFSHENKIHGLTTSGHLAEWDSKGLRWIVRGKSNEVYDHATAAKLRVPDAPVFVPSGRHGKHGEVVARPIKRKNYSIEISASLIIALGIIGLVYFMRS